MIVGAGSPGSRGVPGAVACCESPARVPRVTERPRPRGGVERVRRCSQRATQAARPAPAIGLVVVCTTPSVWQPSACAMLTHGSRPTLLGGIAAAARVVGAVRRRGQAHRPVERGDQERALAGLRHPVALGAKDAGGGVIAVRAEQPGEHVHSSSTAGTCSSAIHRGRERERVPQAARPSAATGRSRHPASRAARVSLPAASSCAHAITSGLSSGRGPYPAVRVSLARWRAEQPPHRPEVERVERRRRRPAAARARPRARSARPPSVSIPSAPIRASEGPPPTRRHPRTGRGSVAADAATACYRRSPWRPLGAAPPLAGVRWVSRLPGCSHPGWNVRAPPASASADLLLAGHPRTAHPFAVGGCAYP